MAGRRRKVSNSAASTIDQTAVRAKKETSVLKPIHKDADEHGWPTFFLTDAVIYRMDGRTLGNPLLVDLEGPFIIRGHLEVDEEEHEPLRTSSALMLKRFSSLTFNC